MRRMVFYAVAAIILGAPLHGFAQTNPAENVVNGNYWKQKVSLFRTLPNPANEVCFLGDSITDQCLWNELTGYPSATNRGIGGDTAWGVRARLDEVTEGKPAAVFLMIGTNDLAWGEKKPEEVRYKIAEILDVIKRESPATRVYLQSVFPVVDGKVNKYENARINQLNAELVQLAAEKKVTWVDVASVLKDDTGQMNSDLTEDGLHLRGTGYYLWLSVIRKYLP